MIYPDYKVGCQPPCPSTRMKYRWVQEDEIGMAIICASTEEYCNPKYLDQLPAVETMASLHSSQFVASQLSGSLVESPVIAVSSALTKSGSDIGQYTESPHINEDGDQTAMASFSFSQLLPPRKSTRVASGSALPAAASEKAAPQVVDHAIPEKPAKKKVIQ